MQDVWDTVRSGMSSWYQGKLFLERAVAISHDSLHVILGVLILLVLSIILRRPISSPRPWLWLAALTLWNETVDLWTERWPDPGMQYGEVVKDVALTLLLPTVLMLAARLRPDMFRKGAGRSRGRR